jgi:tripartite-type tricarboxylate transporter receptor subunit TctC
MPTIGRACALGAGVLMTALGCNAVAATAYPVKPVRVVVGFSAGGGTDIAARILAQRLSENLKQNFFVDNRLGASGTIGADLVAKSPPDGYTLFVGSPTTHSVVPQLLPSVPYHPLRDFVGVSELVYSPMLLVVHPSLPVKTVRDLIRIARAQPDELTYGAGGIGTTPHMAGELFKLATGTKMRVVPYKGEAPAIVDVAGGQISLIFGNLPAVMPQVQAGKLRPVAMTSIRRLKTHPDIPTVAESGVPGYEAGTWFGLFAPVAVPHDIVAKIGAETKIALTAKEVEQKVENIGFFVVASTPEEFDKRLQAEYAKWGKVIRDAGIKMK